MASLIYFGTHCSSVSAMRAQVVLQVKQFCKSWPKIYLLTRANAPPLGESKQKKKRRQRTSLVSAMIAQDRFFFFASLSPRKSEETLTSLGGLPLDKGGPLSFSRTIRINYHANPIHRAVIKII